MTGVLDLEGLWTRYEDPEHVFDEIASLPAEKAMRFEDSMERSSQRFADLLSEIGLETPKEA